MSHMHQSDCFSPLPQITQLIPSYRLAMCDNSPQGIWRTVNDHPGGVQFLDVSESMRVDRTKAVVILPYIQRR